VQLCRAVNLRSRQVHHVSPAHVKTPRKALSFAATPSCRVDSARRPVALPNGAHRGRFQLRSDVSGTGATAASSSSYRPICSPPESRGRANAFVVASLTLVFERKRIDPAESVRDDEELAPPRSPSHVEPTPTALDRSPLTVTVRFRPTSTTSTIDLLPRASSGPLSATFRRGVFPPPPAISTPASFVRDRRQPTDRGVGTPAFDGRRGDDALHVIRTPADHVSHISTPRCSPRRHPYRRTCRNRTADGNDRPLRDRPRLTDRPGATGWPRPCQGADQTFPPGTGSTIMHRGRRRARKRCPPPPTGSRDGSIRSVPVGIAEFGIEGSPPFPADRLRLRLPQRTAHGRRSSVAIEITVDR